LKYIALSLLLASSIYGDQVKSETLGCPTINALKNVPIESLEDPMALSTYAISNGCEIISRGDGVEAVGYDPRNSQERFQKIIYKRTGVTLYVLRSSIRIEQGGKKNGMRF